LKASVMSLSENRNSLSGNSRDTSRLRAS
jgi:hypothetical protein